MGSHRTMDDNNYGWYAMLFTVIKHVFGSAYLELMTPLSAIVRKQV